jgi:hypothetical protein
MGALSCGKTTVAKTLVDNHGWTRIRMAETLKSMLMTMGLTGEELDGALKNVPCELLGGETPRLAMQTIGTEWRDMICYDLWVRCMRPRIAALVKNDPWVKIVIDDIRFPWEVEMVREYGGQIWVVRRPEVEPRPHDGWDKLLVWLRLRKPPHASETYWREYLDAGNIAPVLLNESTIDELQDDIANYLASSLDRP